MVELEVVLKVLVVEELLSTSLPEDPSLLLLRLIFKLLAVVQVRMVVLVLFTLMLMVNLVEMEIFG